MKIKLTLTFLIFASLNLLAQTNSDNLKIGSYSYPNPSIANLIKWVNLTTNEWETEMKMSKFSDRGIDEGGCVYYGTGASLDMAVFSIAKCQKNSMTVIWTDFSRKGITVLDQLITELEPYYKNTDKDNDVVYAFKKGDYVYKFIVSRKSGSEIVFIMRNNLQTNNGAEKTVTSSSVSKEANEGTSLVSLFKKCKGGVFYVIFPGSEGVSFGSGFFLSEDGLAVSNYHVFEGESFATGIILTEDGSKYHVAEIIESNKDNDYIIFRVEKKTGQEFPFVDYSFSAPEIGEKVFAIGNPEGLEKTISDGIVSGFRGADKELMQITVPITHGSSGGPLFNMEGKVVGITSSGLDAGNLNFAVNIQMLRLWRYIK